MATYYGVYFEERGGHAHGGALLDHTSTVMVIDPDGYLKLLFPFTVSAEEMAEDLAQMMQ